MRGSSISENVVNGIVLTATERVVAAKVSAIPISGHLIERTAENVLAANAGYKEETDATVASPANTNFSISFNMLAKDDGARPTTLRRGDTNADSQIFIQEGMRRSRRESEFERASVLTSNVRSRASLSRSGTSHTPTSPDELMQLQKHGILVALKEAKKAELKRVKILAPMEDDKSKTSKVVELNRRYKTQRLRDQKRIKQLLFEYECMQQKNASGELRNMIDLRNQRPINSVLQNKGPGYDRFSGLKTGEDVVLWKQFCGTFDKLGEKAERKFAPKMDVYAEKRRLKLLLQKKTLLNHLLKVHTSEFRMHSVSPKSERDFTKITSCDRSEASYATFASLDSIGRMKSVRESQRPDFVPLLPLLSTTNQTSSSRSKPIGYN